MSKNPHVKKMVDEDEEETEGETVTDVVPVNLEESSEELVRHVNGKFQVMNQEPVQYTVTSNGAISLRSTGSALLDFFSKCGAMRGKDEMLQRYFLLSLCENPSYTMKCLFFMRDIRGGQGERDSFRLIMKLLASDDLLKKYAERNIMHIPEFGRWDDLVYSFGETRLQPVMVRILKEQLEKDMASTRPTLLGKWLPSENASSQKTKRYARNLIRSLQVTPKQYRKNLVQLRRKINVVEQKMSSKRYDRIHYDKIPSLAFKKYNKAFIKNDEVRFKEFLEQVKKGEKKINAGTLYPYDIIRKFLFQQGGQMSQAEIEALSLQWDALPNYLPERENAIVVVDTSGSMFSGVASVQPICVAISLGIYIGERCSLNGFITFSESPTFQRITGRTLQQKVENMRQAAWGCSTNIQSVFDLILSMMVKNQMRNNPITKVFVISDMQFNIAEGGGRGGNQRTNFQVIDDKYRRAGFARPPLVFWNVNASDNTEVSKDESGTFLISGCSPAILNTALTSDPMSYMMKVLNGDRYKMIF